MRALCVRVKTSSPRSVARSVSTSSNASASARSSYDASTAQCQSSRVHDERDVCRHTQESGWPTNISHVCSPEDDSTVPTPATG